MAAGTDAFRVLKFLISQGEDPKQICNVNDRATPLHFAVLSNNFTSAKILLKANANPNAKDSKGNTPYHFAVTSKNRSIMKLLEESGGNALVQNQDGISAIDYAGIENIRTAKLYFLGIHKYKAVMDKSGYTG